ncbi:MAG: FkbM family methyltransferase [Chitinophagaceae bacterium]|nr:MAG: FkbM family methyltransferase [Chitinophagaceae bacterium]
MIRLIKKILSIIGLGIYRINQKGKNTLSDLKSLDIVELKSGKIYWKKYDVVLDKFKYESIIKDLEKLDRLILKTKATLTLESNDKLRINIEGISIYLQTWEELVILEEIFIKGIYNFICDDQYIFIDIGMNVGCTSLYFARSNNVLKVYGFEPFEATFQQAMNNFSINDFSKKICPFNYGLGKEDASLEVDYIPTFKGSMGINGIPSYLSAYENQKILVSIQLKKVVSTFQNIFELNPSNRFVLKIDCEGAEYEIISSLFKERLLGNFEMIMIEWHQKGPEKLISDLLGAKYEILSFDPNNANIGMLYAFNRKSGK